MEGARDEIKERKTKREIYMLTMGMYSIYIYSFFYFDFILFLFSYSKNWECLMIE